MDNERKILQKIFEKPTYHYHIRELAKETGLNPNTIINITNKLLKKGLILKQKKVPLVELFGNSESPIFIWYKRVHNLTMIYESCLVDFLKESFTPHAIIVIGSYSRGEDTEKSDIDIVVLSKHKKSVSLASFEKILKRKIHLMVIDSQEISKEFYTNLINGIVLYGYLS